MPNNIRVLIVDDHDVVREGLRGFLRTAEDFEIVGEASNGRQAVDVCGVLRPDVVLMDLKMPIMDGVEATAKIRQLYPDVQVVILTSFDEDDLVERGLRAGAIGYLIKSANIHETIASIRAAYNGKSMLSPEAAQALIQSRIKPSRASYHLKEREEEVLALMIDGLTNEQIAQKLGLSRSTIKFHVSAILSKLNVESRTEAVALAVRENLLGEK